MDDHERSAALTPGEVADLAIIGARARMDQGDMRPMLYDPQWAGVVIPWLLALNLEVLA